MFFQHLCIRESASVGGKNIATLKAPCKAPDECKIFKCLALRQLARRHKGCNIYSAYGLITCMRTWCWFPEVVRMGIRLALGGDTDTTV